MIKTFPGTSINYGPLLPPSGSVADGALFFKTNFDQDGTSNPPGLYLYGFKFDTNTSIVGDQVGQGWRIASDLANYVQKTGDTISGPLTFTVNSTAALSLQSVAPGIRFTETDQGVNSKEWLLVADGATFQLQVRDDTFATQTQVFTVDRAGLGRLAGQTIWTAGNDGAGSTMDADLLDGQHGTYYLNLANSSGSLDINSRTSGALAVSRGGTNNTAAVQGGVLYGASPTQLAYTPVGSAGQLLQSNGTGQPSWVNASSIPSSTANTLATPRQIALSGNATGSVMFDGSSNVTIVTTVNNSAQLAGLSPSTSAVANTIAQRDASGYLYAAYLNQGSGNNENPSISQVMVTNGSDNFLRKASVSSLASAIAASGGLTGYVAKTGDTMSGSLQVGDGPGDQLTVNGISLFWNGSSILAQGFISAGGNLNSNGGNIQCNSTTNYIQAGVPGSGGLIRLQASGSGNSGYMEFYGLNQIRSGYIGNSGTTGTQDMGGINYVSTYHAFTGSITTTAMSGGGNGSITAAADVIAYSDARLKTNVITIENALKKVQAMRGVEYDRIDSGDHSVGVIAQEVQEVIPSVVHESADGTLGVAYGNLVGVLIEAIKEQQKQIDVLTSRLNALID